MPAPPTQYHTRVWEYNPAHRTTEAAPEKTAKLSWSEGVCLVVFAVNIYIAMPAPPTQYHTRVWEYNPAHRTTEAAPEKTAKDGRRAFEPKATEEALQLARTKLQEMDEKEQAQRVPLWRKHPYYVPVESERTAPHEGSVWPESRP